MVYRIISISIFKLVISMSALITKFQLSDTRETKEWIVGFVTSLNVLRLFALLPP